MAEPQPQEEPYLLLLTLADAIVPLLHGVSVEALQVSYGLENGRQAHTGLDSLIEDRWAKALEENPRLFDGSKFRLRSISWAAEGAAVKVELGLTGYKEYLGTNRLDEPQRLRLEQDGDAAYGDRSAHLSNALGCEAVLVTKDAQVVLLQRSRAVATHAGLYNGPSGHPEPKNVAGAADFEACPDGDSSLAPLAQRVRDELFGSVLQEIVDETNVPSEELSAPLFVGCMADATGKPDVLFLVRTGLDSPAVRARFAEGAAEGWESERMVFWPVTDLASCPYPLTAVTRAALACLPVSLLAQEA